MKLVPIHVVLFYKTNICTEELIPKPLLKIIAVGRAINAIGAVVEAVTEYCHGSFCGDEYLCSSLQKEGRGANVAPEDPIDAACKNYYQCQQVYCAAGNPHH